MIRNRVKRQKKKFRFYIIMSTNNVWLLFYFFFLYVIHLYYVYINLYVLNLSVSIVIYKIQWPKCFCFFVYEIRIIISMGEKKSFWCVLFSESELPIIYWMSRGLLKLSFFFVLLEPSTQPVCSTVTILALLRKMLAKLEIMSGKQLYLLWEYSLTGIVFAHLI